MTHLSVKNNYISCLLPDSTSIAPGGTLNVLAGNLYGNNQIPSGVRANDAASKSYIAGSSELTLFGTFFGSTLALYITILSVIHSKSELRVASQLRWLTSSPTFRLMLLVGATIAAATAVLNIILLPVYVTTDAVMDCQYGWISSAAFREPWTGSLTGKGSWIVSTLVVGGFMLGGALLTVFMVVGRASGLVGASSSKQPSAKLSNAVVNAILVAYTIIVLTVLVGINICFVLSQESPSVPARAKTTLRVVFGVLHDVINLAFQPIAVTTLAKKVGSASPRFVLPATLAFSLTNSLVAPIAGLLLSSQGCFQGVFLPASSVSTSANITRCYFETGCGSQQDENILPPFEVLTLTTTYTVPFVFNSDRCISSIITLYTPQFFFIFTVRIVMILVGWWMSKRGTPWLLVGTRPMRRHFATFVEKRRKVLSRLTPCQRPEDEVQRAAKLISTEALNVLHSAEPVVHSLTLLSTAICFGVFSPVVSIGTLGVFLAQVGTLLVLPGSNDAGYEDFKIPVMCVCMILALHTLYISVGVVATGICGGLVVVAVNWLLIFVATMKMQTLQPAERLRRNQNGNELLEVTRTEGSTSVSD